MTVAMFSFSKLTYLYEIWYWGIYTKSCLKYFETYWSNMTATLQEIQIQLMFSEKWLNIQKMVRSQMLVR
jgi:hypothetical protein